MLVLEYLRRLFEKNHPESHHLKLLVVSIAWMFLWAIFYGFTYSEGDISGDLIHHMNTALSRIDQTIFSKDYLYSDPTTMAYYSPQQVWSIGILYRLTGSMPAGLAILQFFYSALYAFGAWLVAKQMTKNVWIMSIFMLTILQFLVLPVKDGWHWGIMRGPIPVFFPLNITLARSLLLIFIALLFSKRKSVLTAQAGILGLMFTFHAPTGLTLSMGVVPYFLWKLTASTQWVKDLFKWATAYLIGASLFLFNFWVNSSNLVPLTPAENSFLYDFVFYRYPDTYPQVIWRLFTHGDLELDWVAHTALLMVTLPALWGIIAKNGAILLASTGILLGYIYGFVAIPLALFIIWVSFFGKENLKSFQASTWNLALIAYGAFIVCTWLQWAYDIYNAEMRTPPFLIDNARFISVMFPFAFVLFATITEKFKNWGLFIAVCGCIQKREIF